MCMNDLNCTDVNWNLLFPSRRGTVWWGLSIRAAWRSRSFWVSWRICGKSWREDMRGTVWSWRSPRSSTIRYMHLVFPWTFGMAYCLLLFKENSMQYVYWAKYAIIYYAKKCPYDYICQIYLWPWTTKPVIRVNFWKLRFIHKMKAE